MHFQKLLYLLLIVFVIASCKDDEMVINEENPFEQFIGTYEVVAQHTTGLHAVYDDMGQFIGMEERLDEVMHTIDISIAATDSVLVDGFLNNWNHGFTSTNAIALGDTLSIVKEDNDLTRNDYIRGKMWLQDNQLYMDYRWDQSDVWSPDATPEYGEVTAIGTKN